MLKQSRKYVLFGAVALSLLSALAALVDTDGNAATNQTLLGDIDMGVGTLGDLKTFVSTGAVEEANNFTRTNAVLWHDNVASNIAVVTGSENSIGAASLVFGDPTYSMGTYIGAGVNSIVFGSYSSIGDYSIAMGDENYSSDYSLQVGWSNDCGSQSICIGDYNNGGDQSYLFGAYNFARAAEDGEPSGERLPLAYMLGVYNWSEAPGIFLMGAGNHVGEQGSLSLLMGTSAESLHPGSFVWNFYPTNYFEMSVEDIMSMPRYSSHGVGSFNVNPIGGLHGFWIGETNMSDHVVNIVAPLTIGMKNQVISDLESGNVIPYKTDNLRSENGDTDYTATDLLTKATNASVFAVNELARTNSVLSNGPYVQQPAFTNTVKAIVTNAVPSWSDWAYSGDVTAGVTYNIVSSQNGGGYSFRLYDFATDTLLATSASLEEHPTTLLFSVTGGTITATRIRAYYSDVEKVDGKVNTVSNWVENLDTSYFRTNVAIAAAATRVVCPSNQNQTVQYINAPAGVSTIEISLPKDGMTKDWLVYILATDEINIVLPPANYWATSETVTNKIEASTATALYFSQISDNIYSIGRQDNLVPITVLSTREVLMQSIREKSKKKSRRLVK